MELSAKDILNELAERQLAKKVAPGITLSADFPVQTDFIADPATLKAALCTRRAGKSYGAGLYLFQEALAHPGVSCVYIALTRESARRIMWKDVLKEIDRKYKLGANFNKSTLDVTLPNGSVIYLMGADSTEEEREKLLGQKYRLAIIDESASFKTDLRDLVYNVLGPAMIDNDGTICMIGTPSNLKKSLFFDVTTGAERGWSVHQWSALDNPFERKKYEKKIAELKAKSPQIIETPGFKQNYLGQWVVDDNALVYKFDSSRNLFNELPEFVKGSWHHVLGVDLGYEDDSAFVLMAYHDLSPSLHVLSAFKQTKMDVTDVAKRILLYTKTYDIDAIVIDGANKQAVQEIQNRHGIPLKTADKRGKADFIEILNGELIQGTIRLHVSDCEVLVDEMLGLVWNERSTRKEEHPSCPNHACDAFLYAWRHCYAFLAEPVAPPAHPVSSRAYWEQQAEAEFERELREMHAKQNDDPWAHEPTQWSGNGW